MKRGRDWRCDRAADPQLIEMDRGSKRTQGRHAVPGACRCRIVRGHLRTTGRPSSRNLTNPLGAVDMHLAILSRSPMRNALRTLALLDEPRIVQVISSAPSSARRSRSRSGEPLRLP